MKGTLGTLRTLRSVQKPIKRLDIGEKKLEVESQRKRRGKGRIEWKEGGRGKGN